MKRAWIVDPFKTVASYTRACVVVIALAVMLLTFQHCPTGQSSCLDANMDMQTDGSVCLLACGVPLQQSIQTEMAASGKVSPLPSPPATTFYTIPVKPDVPPPRFHS